MEYFDDLDNDMSWLTQEPKIEEDGTNFNVGYKFIEEDLLCDNVVSLEESEVDVKRTVLYDNMLVEEISSDEKLDLM